MNSQIHKKNSKIKFTSVVNKIYEWITCWVNVIYFFLDSSAWAAANLAIGTLYGEQET